MNTPPPEATRYTFRLDEIIYLSPTVRAFLLESICLRLNLQGYAKHCLRLLLEEDGQSNLTGCCPFCGNAGFLLNKRSGESHCASCGKKEDLLALTHSLNPSPTTIMNDALLYLSAYTKVEAKWQAEAAAAAGRSE